MLQLTLIDGIYPEFSMLQIQSGNGLPKNPQNFPLIRRVKEVFHSPGLRVEIVAVTGVEGMKDHMKVCPWSLQKQIVRVGHQTEAENILGVRS